MVKDEKKNMLENTAHLGRKLSAVSGLRTFWFRQQKRFQPLFGYVISLDIDNR